MRKKWYVELINAFVHMNYLFYGLMVPFFIMFLVFSQEGWSFNYFVIGIASLLFVLKHLKSVFLKEKIK